MHARLSPQCPSRSWRRRRRPRLATPSQRRPCAATGDSPTSSQYSRRCSGASPPARSSGGSRHPCGVATSAADNVSGTSCGHETLVTSYGRATLRRLAMLMRGVALLLRAATFASCLSALSAIGGWAIGYAHGARCDGGQVSAVGSVAQAVVDPPAVSHITLLANVVWFCVGLCLRHHAHGHCHVPLPSLMGVSICSGLFLRI